jgi:predicted Zn-dependent protease with MMP-like domain
MLRTVKNGGHPDIEGDLERAWTLLDEGDLGAAARALESARAAAPNDPEVLELTADLALTRDEPKTALQAYQRWMTLDPLDPDPWLGAAEVHLYRLDDPQRAAQILRGFLVHSELDSLEEADARHLLGLALEELGDRKGMVREWLEVLRLDTEADEEAEDLLSNDQFERIAADALDELPAELLQRLGNVPVLVADRPSEDDVRDGLDPRTLGLFTGLPMPDQSFMGGPPHTGVIHLFRRNLEVDAESKDDLAEEIRITVVHETAHYFGLTDDDLERLGLG